MKKNILSLTLLVAIFAYNSHLFSMGETNRDVNRKEETKSNPITIHQAVRGGDLETIRYLIEEQNVDKNEEAEDGGKPIHCATEFGHLGIVQYLIEQHVDKNEQVEDDGKPIHYAAANGHLSVLQYLVENGTDITESAMRNAHAGTHQYLQCVKEFRELGNSQKIEAYRAAKAEFPSDHEEEEGEVSVGEKEDIPSYQEILYAEAAREVIEKIKEQENGIYSFFEQREYENTLAYAMYEEKIDFAAPTFRQYLKKLAEKTNETSSIIGLRALENDLEDLEQEEERIIFDETAMEHYPRKKVNLCIEGKNTISVTQSLLIHF